MASDKEISPVSAEAGPKFTEREEKLIKIAMFCLKNGPPEIDMAKFTELGEFNTAKTAANTWGKIKNKLKELDPATADSDGANTQAAPTPKAKATPKKRGKVAAEEANAEDGNEGASPPKKAKATPAKKGGRKGAVAVKNEDEDVDEEITFGTN